MSSKSFELTTEEKKAIAAFKRLAKKWPKSLWLYSASGSMCVMRKDENNQHSMVATSGDPGADPEYIVARIDIENDGGDW